MGKGLNHTIKLCRIYSCSIDSDMCEDWGKWFRGLVLLRLSKKGESASRPVRGRGGIRTRVWKGDIAAEIGESLGHVHISGSLPTENPRIKSF